MSLEEVVELDFNPNTLADSSKLAKIFNGYNDTAKTLWLAFNIKDGNLDESDADHCIKFGQKLREHKLRNALHLLKLLKDTSGDSHRNYDLDFAEELYLYILGRKAIAYKQRSYEWQISD
ncbi:MAG: hypothetical protein AABW84_02015 [Nanoarchaeota archaeon]